MTDQSLTCKELVELVTEYLENTLPQNDRVCFENHIKGCTGCRTYLEQMRQTIQVVGHLSEETIAPDAKDELLNIFRNWNSGES